MPNNPNIGSFTSNRFDGPRLLIEEDVNADAAYGYTSWINLSGIERWSVLIKNTGAVAVANLRVQYASLQDGNGEIHTETQANGPAPANTWWIDQERFDTARLSIYAMPVSVRFGWNTAGAAGTLRYHVIGVHRR